MHGLFIWACRKCHSLHVNLPCMMPTRCSTGTRAFYVFSEASPHHSQCDRTHHPASVSTGSWALVLPSAGELATHPWCRTSQSGSVLPRHVLQSGARRFAAMPHLQPFPSRFPGRHAQAPTGVARCWFGSPCTVCHLHPWLWHVGRGWKHGTVARSKGTGNSSRSNSGFCPQSLRRHHQGCWLSAGATRHRRRCGQTSRT